jgi:hypothetical protein
MSDDKLVKAYAEMIIREKKRKYRAVKALWELQEKMKALPKVKSVYIKNNYVNPVTLSFPPKGVIVYEVKNRTTGRTNYYNSNTFWKLAGHAKNDYKLLMFDPKLNIFKNPVTRNPVSARNIQRVRVKPESKTPTKSAAARKIQSAVRAHLKKKKTTKK